MSIAVDNKGLFSNVSYDDRIKLSYLIEQFAQYGHYDLQNAYFRLWFGPWDGSHIPEYTLKLSYKDFILSAAVSLLRLTMTDNAGDISLEDIPSQG